MNDRAELWGRRFTTQLDVDLLKLAAKSYRQASIKAKRGRPDEINPLSVNVYPETLMRKIYFDTRDVQLRIRKQPSLQTVKDEENVG
ncbi:MAG: hypothetical protein M1G31_17940 [Pseudanabaena sp. Salubria-1]|nr:hypothetical protein [Pseudanabaena sp. Salubria-1]